MRSIQGSGSSPAAHDPADIGLPEQLRRRVEDEVERAAAVGKRQHLEIVVVPGELAARAARRLLRSPASSLPKARPARRVARRARPAEIAGTTTISTPSACAIADDAVEIAAQPVDADMRGRGGEAVPLQRRPSARRARRTGRHRARHCGSRASASVASWLSSGGNFARRIELEGEAIGHGTFTDALDGFRDAPPVAASKRLSRSAGKPSGRRVAGARSLASPSTRTAERLAGDAAPDQRLGAHRLDDLDVGVVRGSPSPCRRRCAPAGRRARPRCPAPPAVRRTDSRQAAARGPPISKTGAPSSTSMRAGAEIHRRRADEAGDEAVGRPVVDLVRRRRAAG